MLLKGKKYERRQEQQNLLVSAVILRKSRFLWLVVNFYLFFFFFISSSLAYRKKKRWYIQGHLPFGQNFRFNRLKYKCNARIKRKIPQQTNDLRRYPPFSVPTDHNGNYRSVFTKFCCLLAPSLCHYVHFFFIHQ